MKKLVYLPLVVAAVGLLFCTACKKKEIKEEPQTINSSEQVEIVEIEDGPIEMTQLPISKCIHRKIEFEQLVMINSQSEYESLFSGCEDSLYNIDFAHKTLFVVWGGTPDCILNKRIACEKQNNKINISIDIINGDCTAPDYWRYLFYIDYKVTDKENVSLKINKRYGACTFCNVENPLTELPWLKSLVQFYSTDTLHRSSISTCLYDSGKEGFLIADCIDCPDAGLDFMDCAGNDIGVLFGITGNDYAKYNIDKNSIKLIYKNY